jgi:AcrR family transcriptional regulator
MALLPLRQAADAAGVSRQTLYRYVKDGRITATVGHDGQKQVDTSELLRVFGKLREPVTDETGAGDSVRPAETGREAPQAPPETAQLQVELAAAQALLGMTQAELAATREREARLLGVVESQTRLLEYRQPEQTSSVAWPWLALAATVAAVVAASAWLAANRQTPPPAPPQTQQTPPPQQTARPPQAQQRPPQRPQTAPPPAPAPVQAREAQTPQVSPPMPTTPPPAPATTSD